MADREVDDPAGRLVVGLVDPAAVTALDPSSAGSIAPPAARAMLPRFGCPPGGLRLTGLLIAQVQEALGSDRPARYQQACLLGDHRERVDDAKVYPGQPTRVQVVLVDGHGGGDGQPEPPTIGHQGHRPDLVGSIRERPGQPYP